MEKILISADNINSSQEILSSLNNIVTTPRSIVLLHVQQLLGNSLMTSMLTDSEISTLKESIKETEHEEKLQRKAEKVIHHYRNELEERGIKDIKSVIKAGNPSDEILKVAEEEKVDLIIVGCSGKSRFKKFATGCATRDVEKHSRIRVLITKNSGCGKHAHLWGRGEVYAV